jgi:hypothetical protein
MSDSKCMGWDGTHGWGDELKLVNSPAALSSHMLGAKMSKQFTDQPWECGSACCWETDVS